ncbi:MAG: FAD-dependent oxidoreductase, partial [Acidobacteriaceae bacterium]
MTTEATIAVIGAGPAGIAAVRELRHHTGVHVVLVAPGGLSAYRPGTLSVATSDARAVQYTTRVKLDGVEVIAARAEAIDSGTLRIEGTTRRVDAIIAAPGLALEPLGPTTPENVVSFWDPIGAETAAPQIRALERGVIDVVIASLPYSCPPAPYGLAMRLARHAQRLGQQIQVRLTTPEEYPLAAVGRVLGDALLTGCREAGVEVRLGVTIDLDAIAAGAIGATTHPHDEANLTVAIPRHCTSPLLNGLTNAT